MEQSALFATSRLTVTEYNADCDFSQPTCDYTNTTDPTTYYIADIERFTLMIDHTIYATNIDIQRNARELNGQLVDYNGNAMEANAFPNVVGVPKEYDYIEIGTLLQAAGVSTLDADGKKNEKSIYYLFFHLALVSDVPESLRHAGIVLLVIISYTNTVLLIVKFVITTYQ